MISVVISPINTYVLPVDMSFQGKWTRIMKCEGYGDATEYLRKHAKNIMMNSDRRDKVLMLLDILEDVLLVDELTQIAYRRIRGEKLERDQGT